MNEGKPISRKDIKGSERIIRWQQARMRTGPGNGISGLREMERRTHIALHGEPPPQKPKARPIFDRGNLQTDSLPEGFFTTTEPGIAVFLAEEAAIARAELHRRLGVREEDVERNLGNAIERISQISLRLADPRTRSHALLDARTLVELSPDPTQVINAAQTRLNGS